MRLWEMGNLTANPRRFFGAFCSVVNTLSGRDGRCATATDSRNMERLEGSHCTDTDTLQEACTGAGFGTSHLESYKEAKILVCGLAVEQDTLVGLKSVADI